VPSILTLLICSRPSCNSIRFMYNLTILLRKANATTECENDVRELRLWGGFAKLCVPLEKSWLRPWTELHQGGHIDDMTKKWLSQTPNPPRTPEFYTLTKLHKPTVTGRPISGCDGPTERISSFVDSLLQPISKSQTSYLKDTTDFINFIEKTKVKKRTFLVSMDVYTQIFHKKRVLPL